MANVTRPSEINQGKVLIELQDQGLWGLDTAMVVDVRPLGSHPRRPLCAVADAGAYKTGDIVEVRGGQGRDAVTIVGLADPLVGTALEGAVVGGVTLTAWLVAAGRPNNKSDDSLIAAWRAGESPSGYEVQS